MSNTDEHEHYNEKGIWDKDVFKNEDKISGILKTRIDDRHIIFQVSYKHISNNNLKE